MKTSKITIISASLLAVNALNGQTTGSVTGTVLENGVLPLSGATISYMGTGYYERGPSGFMRYSTPQIMGRVQSRADGTFSITGLPPDKYEICAGGTLPIHISSCGWNASNPRVTLASGQNLTGIRLTVTRGALLNITIADSTGCASRYSRAAVYVFAGPSSQVASRVSNTAGAYNYQVLVPQSTPLRLHSYHRCDFSDANGYALAPTGLSIPAVHGESADVSLTAR